jgi:hypothetical protein
LHFSQRLAGIAALALVASTACNFPSGLTATNPTLSMSPSGSFAVNAPIIAPHALQASSVAADEQALSWTVLPAPVERPTLATWLEADALESSAAMNLRYAAVVPAERQEIAFSSFRLAVPFRTQKDGSRFQGSNCGPATLGMVLEAFGMTQSNDDLRFETHTYQDTVGRRGGTALQHMASVALDYGVAPLGLYAGREEFAAWTIDDVRSELRAGRPVIPLVKYRLLPGYEGSTVRYDHYIVLHGISGDGFVYHDPAQESPVKGASRWISAEQLDHAMSSASISRQAVAFDRSSHAPLAAVSLRG